MLNSAYHKRSKSIYIIATLEQAVTHEVMR